MMKFVAGGFGISVPATTRPWVPDLGFVSQQALRQVALPFEFEGSHVCQVFKRGPGDQFGKDETSGPAFNSIWYFFSWPIVRTGHQALIGPQKIKSLIGPIPYT